MKRIYIAGKLSDDACGYIKNLHRMIETARSVRRAGFSVYVPGNDFLEGLVAGNFEYSEYFNNSQPWLAVSDAVFLTPGWEDSAGTKREIEYANLLGIPVFENLNEMMMEMF